MAAVAPALCWRVLKLRGRIACHRGGAWSFRWRLRDCPQAMVYRRCANGGTMRWRPSTAGRGAKSCQICR
ncbi:hypothetical protein KCP69_03325 [Salmonella enterica subsp. enterica]|nr:hypothetical protein KCP69_03325 [Salmonella enterica subsp. enterica]